MVPVPAIIFLDSFVNFSDVGREVCPVGVGRLGTAQLAAERLPAQMYVHVLFQHTFLQEALDWLAYSALERLVFISGVGTLDVAIQLLLGHHDTTLVATHLLVGLVMSVELGDLREGLRTLITLVNLGTVVSLVVESHVNFGYGLGTDWADDLLWRVCLFPVGIPQLVSVEIGWAVIAT